MALDRINQLDWLNTLFSQVQIPQTTLAECTFQPELLDAQRVQRAVTNGWLTLCQDVDFDAPGLQAGERAAIGCALQIRAALLVDDSAARLVAAGLSIPVVGTLGLLIRAKHIGLVGAIAPVIEQLRAGGHYLGARSVIRALSLAGE